MSKVLGVQNKKGWAVFLKFFVFTIAIHWGMMLLSYILLSMTQGVEESFFAMYVTKFISGGDTPHYINIATNGYMSSGESANLIVFYPLYPLLMKIVWFIVRDYFVAGVLVSNICLGVSGYYLYRLVDGELGERKAIDGYMIYLVYPFGVFLVGVFTESLFMMLVIMALFYMRKEKWLLAGTLGMLAAFARSQGIALLVPAVYEVVLYIKRQKRFDIRTLGAFIIPLGTVGYLLINKLVQGDWYAFAEHQAAPPWYNTSNWISTNLAQHYNMAQEYFSLALIIYWAQIILYFAAIIMLFYGIKKKVSTSIIAYGGAYIFLSFLHGWLISGPRYMMGCVSLYVIYAAIDNKIVKTALLLGCAIIAIFITLGSWQGQAIM